MADKKDMSQLLSVLVRLCQDYGAMKYVLQHYGPEKWRSLVSDWKSQPGLVNPVSHLFDEMNERLQSDQPDAALFESLIESLNQMTLL